MATNFPKLISAWNGTNGAIEGTKAVLDQSIQGNVSQTIGQYLENVWVQPVVLGGVVAATPQVQVGHWRVPGKNHGYAFNPEFNNEFLQQPYKTLKQALGIQFPADVGNEKTIAFSLQDGTRVTVSLNVDLVRSKQNQAVLVLDEASLKIRDKSKVVTSTGFTMSESRKDFKYDVSVVPGSVDDTSKVARKAFSLMIADPLTQTQENSANATEPEKARNNLIIELAAYEAVLRTKLPEKISDSEFAAEVEIVLRGKLFLPIQQLNQLTVQSMTEINLDRMRDQDWKALVLLNSREQFAKYLMKSIPRGVNSEIRKSSRNQNYYNVDPKNPYKRDFQVLLNVGDLPLQTCFTINMLAQQAEEKNTHFLAQFVTFVDVPSSSGLDKKRKRVSDSISLGYNQDHTQWVVEGPKSNTTPFTADVAQTGDAATEFATRVNALIAANIDNNILKNHLLHYTIQAPSILKGFKVDYAAAGGNGALVPVSQGINADDEQNSEIVTAFE